MHQKTARDQNRTRSQSRRKNTRRLGRPRVRRPFEQTGLGFLLQHEAPVEYRLLLEVMEGLKIRTPPADLIEKIGYSSDTPLFAKAKYRRALMEYRRTGLYPRKPKITNASRELYYIRLRHKCIKSDMLIYHN